MKKKDHRSQAQILLGIHIRELSKFLRIEYEFRFHGGRQWKADVYLPDLKLLIECDGGLYPGGKGHKRGDALADDYMKQNVAQMLGYRLLRFSNQQVAQGEAKEFLRTWGIGDKP
jgi:very-short-patch-repair endonuclease